MGKNGVGVGKCRWVVEWGDNVQRARQGWSGRRSPPAAAAARGAHLAAPLAPAAAAAGGVQLDVS